MILEPKKIKSVTVSIVSPSICHKVTGDVISISEVIDTSLGNLDFSLRFIQPGISHDVL